ncbi:MAG: S8/S53 family peptidase [Bacteroidota bacterium]
MRIIALILAFAAVVFAQDRTQKYWIYFTDKENSSLSKHSSYRQQARDAGLTDRAVQRRMKMGINALSERDLPVSESYLTQLKNAGIAIDNTSRWFNAATTHLTETQVKMIAGLSFIKEIEPVRSFKRKELPQIESSFLKESVESANAKFAYGSSLTQMELMNAVQVHNIGISGRGVLIGMLDTGFRWKEHEAMQNMKVVAEYDFIQKDTITANQDGEALSQDSHGTSTMSLVGGYKEGQLVSPAFNAYFMLGKTEYVPTETNVEEDNWVAAIEWMESNGVDVVSSSLGYSEFDAGQSSYTYADLNGQTATTTRAAAIAAHNGVVVVNSMGNEAGTAWKFLTTPADADSIISVGAVNSLGNYAAFSSVGPTSDGRTKPDVVAHGVGTYCAIPPGKVTAYTNTSQGTSLSTPLVAGVAAMILSARPELTPVQVRDALRNTASNTASPNNTIGWGIVNAYNALLYHGMVIGTDPDVTLTVDSNYSISMFVVSPNQVNKDSVKLHYSTDNGGSFSTIHMSFTDTIDAATSSGRYNAVIPGVTASTEVKFYVTAKDQSTARTGPYGAPSQLYSTMNTTTGIKPVLPPPSTYVLRQNYPNPFNPSTTISYDLPAADFVTLKVYDILGKEVATLVNGFQTRNRHEVTFSGAGLASGVYFYRLQTALFSEVKKMVLVK